MPASPASRQPSPTTIPASDAPSQPLAEYQKAGTKALLITLSLFGPLISLAIYLRDGLTPLTGMVMVISALLWTAHVLFRREHEAWAAGLMFTAMISGSVLAIVLQGSVRSTAVMVLIAMVITAGTLLNARAMVATTVVCIGALALLNVAEQMGWMRRPNLGVGLAVWLTQSATLVTVLVSVYFGRKMLTDALTTQAEALARSRQIEQQLRMSERRFAALFQNNPAATLVQHTQTLEVLDVNDAFVRMFGLNREQLAGLNPSQLWSNASERQRFQQQVVLQGRVSGFQATGQRSDGSTFEAQVSGELVTQDTDTLVVLIVLDMSEQLRARRAIENSEERFSKAFNFSPLGMTITRLSDGRFMDANPANEQVLGYKPEDFIGTQAFSAPIWLSEEDQKQYIRTLTTNGKLKAYETRLRSKNGLATDVRLWAEMIELQGEPSVLAFTMNVTEEKRREALLIDLATGVSGDTGLPFFRSLVRHMAHALGADLVIVGEMQTPGSVQTLAAHFEGGLVPNIKYQVEGTACGHAVAHMGDCFYANDLAEQYPTDQFPIGGGYDTYMGIALLDADGSPIGILKALWVTPKASTNELQALMRIFSSRCNAELVRLRRDREIQKLGETLEQKVAERTAQLEYLNRELDSFSYTVSHDLKSPLRSIDGFMHVLQEQLGERIRPQELDSIARVQGAVARMSQLIHDLLGLARVSQNDLQRQWIDLSRMAKEVLFVEQQRDPGHVVEIRIAPWIRAFCDPRLTRIVLENLLGNAWKYSRKADRPHIEFGRMTGPQGEPPSFFVQDNGAGFDMSRSDRLFKPFNRLHSAKEFEGSGVGLATVRRIIERHNGSLKGTAIVGQGATFVFSFGAQPVALGDGHQGQASEKPIKPEVVPSQPIEAGE